MNLIDKIMKRPFRLQEKQKPPDWAAHGGREQWVKGLAVFMRLKNRFDGLD